MKIKPFFGYTPKPESAKKVVSPPYDVLNRKEARKYASGNEMSFLHVNKAEIDLDDEISPYDDKVYTKAKENLDSFIEKKFLVKEEKKVFYIYAQIKGSHTQKGIICLTSTQEYDEGKIKRHEFTRKAKEADRTKIVDIQNANAGPVFLSFRKKESLEKLIKVCSSGEPHIDVFSEFSQDRHVLWKVDNDELIEKFVTEFNDVPALYICDGHHRVQSASNVSKLRREKILKEGGKVTGEEPFNFMLSVVFPENHLAIFDYNRVIKFQEGMNQKAVMDHLEKMFKVEEIPTNKEEVNDGLTPPHFAKSINKGVFSMYLMKKWYSLITNPEFIPKNDPVGSLDSAILTETVLTPLFGIKDIRTSKKLDFVGGTRGYKELEKLVNKQQGEKTNGISLAFGVCPVSMEELMEVADSGNVMPPKSTWFVPKLLSGLVLRLIED